MRAWKIALLGLGGLLAAGFVANLVNPQPQTRPSITVSVSQMMRQEEALNNRCRGGSGDDPKTNVACHERDRLLDRLKAAGTCWGNPNDPNQIGADKTWQPCNGQTAKQEKPLNPHGASTLYKLAHPEEGVRYAEAERDGILSERVNGQPADEGAADLAPLPEVRYDPKVAADKLRMDAALRATRGCLRGEAQQLMMRGYKDREQMADYLSGACARPLLFIHAPLDEDALLKLTKQMAYEAIRDVELENGG